MQCKKAFRNPSIYEKLIIHCNIDELGRFLVDFLVVTLVVTLVDVLVVTLVDSLVDVPVVTPPPGTNFPPALYDGHLFGKESYYEELAKVQKAEMDRREKVSSWLFL